jgi:hypothetical protein
MSNDPNSSSKDNWLKVLLLVLGVTLPIIVTRIFQDLLVYIALMITVGVLIALFLLILKSKRWKIITSGVTIIVAVTLAIIINFATRPKFEINLLDLPLGEEATYYVTDPLIRAGGDLSEYDSFSVSPQAIEVIPNYFGDKKYGNLVLRISGNSSSKDIPLWTDFEKSSQTQTVKLDLAEIIKISGIHENLDEIDTNLMVGEKPYQEASLKFEVIRLSEPNKPFRTSKTMIVKNTPWKQTASVTERNGWVFDYALTNLGREAIFHCRILVVRTISDITENDSPFWSGIDDKSENSLKCPSFTLGNGETHTFSIPLDKSTLGEVPHGRYLVEAYTYAERKDVEFKNNLTFEDSDNMWVFSNDASIGTFVICSDPGKTCQETATLPIEKTTTIIYTYTSFSELNNGISSLVTKTYPVGNYSANQYIVDFQLDPERDGWIGLAIWFEPPIDVSNFSSIRFKMTLDPSQHSIWMDAKDYVNGVYNFKRFEVVNANYGSQDSEEQTVVIPFSEYPGIDWTSLDTLDFMVDGFMVPTDQHYKFNISEIEFIH